MLGDLGRLRRVVAQGRGIRLADGLDRETAPSQAAVAEVERDPVERGGGGDDERPGQVHQAGTFVVGPAVRADAEAAAPVFLAAAAANRW